MGLKFILEAAGKTDIGLAREHNEDYYAIEGKQCLFIVADGLGGHEAGEIASKLATDAILNFFQKIPAKDDLKESVIADKINEAIQTAHKIILEASLKDVSLKKMGTTIVLALWQPPDIFHIANVGDSRAYLIRNQKIGLLSHDNSLITQLVEQGEITLEEARKHRLRNVVTQALGIELSTKCYYRKIKVKSADKIILCSDGLYDMLSDDNIKNIVINEGQSERICRNLIDAAKENGGKDNITIISISIKERHNKMSNNTVNNS